MWASTIGKKALVAVTGVILAAWIALHALGNLKAVEGPGGGNAASDSYAEWLRTVGHPLIPRDGLLWAVRAVLVVSLVMHVVAIVQLSARNRTARAQGHRPPRVAGSVASRTMLISGFAILAFLVFHLLQFTTHTIQVTPVHSGDVYENLYDAFQKWYFAAIYVIAVALLGLHLHHALWSASQTGGFDKPNRNATFRRGAAVVSIGVAGVFAITPILFFAGALPEPVRDSGTVALHAEGAR
jgi:succinate dehydrogenase / fumarate reductase cytochrome b subunit